MVKFVVKQGTGKQSGKPYTALYVVYNDVETFVCFLKNR